MITLRLIAEVLNMNWMTGMNWVTGMDWVTVMKGVITMPDVMLSPGVTGAEDMTVFPSQPNKGGSKLVCGWR